MKNTKNGFTPIVTILLVVVAVLAISGGAYYVSSKKNNNAAEQPQAEQKQGETVTNSTQSIESELADWKTYRNDEYGFEMKYPNTWAFKELLGGYPDSFSIMFEAPKEDVYHIGRRIALRCLAEYPLEPNINRAGVGKNINLTINGTKITITGEDMPTPRGEEGEPAGFGVSYCKMVDKATNGSKNCIRFSGWETPIDEIDQKIIESITFSKDLKNNTLKCY